LILSATNILTIKTRTWFAEGGTLWFQRFGSNALVPTLWFQRFGSNALVPTLWFQRFGDLGSLCRDAYMEHDLQQRNSDPPFLGANDVRWRCNGLRYDCHASGA